MLLCFEDGMIQSTGNGCIPKETYLLLVAKFSPFLKRKKKKKPFPKNAYFGFVLIFCLKISKH